MGLKDEAFLDELRATFQVEAEEHLQAISTGLPALEKTHDRGQRLGVLEAMFRAAHSLKGAARAVDFVEIETICQSMEDIFASWKREETTPTRSALDQVDRALSAISVALARGAPRGSSEKVESSGSGFRRPDPPAGAAHSDSILRIEPLAPVGSPGPSAAPAPLAEAKATAEQTVRIAVSKLDTQLWEAEQMLTAKLMAGHRATQLRDIAQRFAAWRKEWTAIEPSLRLARQLTDATPPADGPQRLGKVLDFFDRGLDGVKALEATIAELSTVTKQDYYIIGKLVDDLLEDAKKLLLLPFATISAPLPKLVRDLCREQGKDADLLIHGEEVEIDKRVLEEMKDPLIHILRNCVDHGIETPEERLRSTKPPRAAISIAVRRVDGNKVQLRIADDGAGIDAREVKKSAVKHGHLSAAEADRLDEAAAAALVFQPDVSTSPIITRLSGRGLGLAIVREKAERLGGAVSIESRPRQGTSITIVLPTMLATFRGILVEVVAHQFVVPTFDVERVMRVKLADVRTVEGRETIAMNGRTLAFVRLAAVLELPPPRRGGEPSPTTEAIVLGTGDQRVAFAVDSVLDEREVLVKPLRKPLSRLRNIAGATVLVSGEVVPILSVPDLLKSAPKAAAAPVRSSADAPTKAPAKSILVAEDSITSRMLVKSVLESAGYAVKTAVDGAEAFALLRTEHFDLLVSDVEMPRLNGFDLTAKVRADAKLGELPVVLVSALETREDRERGIDVGANAYLVKSSFDQSDLLDAVRRLA